MMELVYQRMIRRADLRKNPESVYVFGDNVQRQGLGGQAKECRGEPNALGVVTKWQPGRDDGDYFSDGDHRCAIMVMRDLGRLFAVIGQRRVVLPYDGLGTGLAELPERAPKLHALIVYSLVLVSNGQCPWAFEEARQIASDRKEMN
jgi:hypothetical protein